MARIFKTSGYEAEGAPGVCFPLHRSCHLLPPRQRLSRCPIYLEGLSYHHAILIKGYRNKSRSIMNHVVSNTGPGCCSIIVLFQCHFPGFTRKFLAEKPSILRIRHGLLRKTHGKSPSQPGFEHEKVQLCATCQKMVRSETGSAGVMFPGRDGGWQGGMSRNMK